MAAHDIGAYVNCENCGGDDDLNYWGWDGSLLCGRCRKVADERRIAAETFHRQAQALAASSTDDSANEPPDFVVEGDDFGS